MKCPNCLEEHTDNAKFCPGCGAKVKPPVVEDIETLKERIAKLEEIENNRKRKIEEYKNAKAKEGNPTSKRGRGFLDIFG